MPRRIGDVVAPASVLLLAAASLIVWIVWAVQREARWDAMGASVDSLHMIWDVHNATVDSVTGRMFTDVAVADSVRGEILAAELRIEAKAETILTLLRRER